MPSFLKHSTLLVMLLCCKQSIKIRQVSENTFDTKVQGKIFRKIDPSQWMLETALLDLLQVLFYTNAFQVAALLGQPKSLCWIENLMVLVCTACCQYGKASVFV